MSVEVIAIGGYEEVGKNKRRSGFLRRAYGA